MLQLGSWLSDVIIHTRSRRNNSEHDAKIRSVTSRPANDHVLRAAQRPLFRLSGSRDTADQFNWVTGSNTRRAWYVNR